MSNKCIEKCVIFHYNLIMNLPHEQQVIRAYKKTMPNLPILTKEEFESMLFEYDMDTLSNDEYRVFHFLNSGSSYIVTFSSQHCECPARIICKHIKFMNYVKLIIWKSKHLQFSNDEEEL